jgi:hypothetical protein
LFMKTRLLPVPGLVLLACAPPALAQDDPATGGEKPWSLSLGGGATLVSQGSDPWSTNVDLSRSIGDASLSIGYSRSTESGQQGVPLSLGSRNETISLSAGYGMGRVALDLHGSYGVRRFDGRSFRRRTGQVVTIDGKGKSYGLGATATVWVPLGENTSMSPYASVDYSSTDTARAAVLPLLGLVSVKDKATGTTGSVGASLDQNIGSQGQHSISANAAWVMTSNSAATSGTLTRRSGAARPLRPQPGAGGSESWFEFGANASFTVSQVVALSLSASRTAGSVGPETTSLYSGISFSF